MMNSHSSADRPARAERIAIIGAGHVGATTAYALMLRALFREIVLIDSDAALAKAEAADLSDANALARPARIWAGGYADAAAATIAVITAGAATHGSQSRISLAVQSAVIVSACVDELIGSGFQGIILVASNPVDVMSAVAFQRSGFPASRVIGTGTLLDTSRLHQKLSELIGVAPSSFHGMVLGEHGDSEVVAFSSIRIGGIELERIGESASKLDHDAIAREVRQAAYEIIAGKGYTSFGVATSIVRICEAIIRDERTVLPVSAWLTGQFGIERVYLSLPCIVGRDGVQKVLLPRLSDDETSALRLSAKVLRGAIADLEPKILSNEGSR